jgi:hypothetical protein
MHSALAVTFENLDMAAAARDLAAQIRRDMPPVTHRCGVLFTEGEGEWDELLATLQAELDMPLVGCTGTAQISSKGYYTLAATLLAFGGDDCRFGSAMTGVLGAAPQDALRAAFAAAKDQLGGEPLEAVFVFSANSPALSEDDKMALLDELAGGKPVFGAIASDYFTFDAAMVFCGEQAAAEAVTILAVGGNVRPRFVVRNLPTSTGTGATVTRSDGYRVQKVGDKTPYELMSARGIDTSSAMGLFYAPLCLELENEDDYDGVPICRTFKSIDGETGEGWSLTRIPEGARLTVQPIQNTDIESTAREALTLMLETIAAEERNTDYVYSTILGVTCAARLVVLAAEQSLEGDLARAMLPERLRFAAFYSYGEFCPTSIRDGKAKNRVNNLTIGLCAL